jgi:hypothetical protein
MSKENSRKRERENDHDDNSYFERNILKYEEVKEEYVGIITADTIGEPLTSLTLSQFHKESPQSNYKKENNKNT